MKMNDSVRWKTSAFERLLKKLKQGRLSSLTFFSAESVDIDFVHPEYDVAGLDLQNQQTPFLWKRILREDQLVWNDELPVKHPICPWCFGQSVDGTNSKG